MNRDSGAAASRHCPSHAELQDFTAGRLPSPTAAAIAEHLASCSACSERLSAIDDDPLCRKIHEILREGTGLDARGGSLIGRVESLYDFRVRIHENEVDEDDAALLSIHYGSPVRVRCPHCSESIDAPDADLRMEITCPRCEGPFRLEENVGDPDDLLPRQYAHFTLLECLGEGSVGRVWRAVDSMLDRHVAIKIPRRSCMQRAEMDSFLHEARVAASVRHHNIVTVLEIGREADSVYIATNLVEGKSLLEYLEGAPLAWSEAARIAIAIAEALDAAHRVGVIHRDLKPGNILIDEAGEPFITDFGLAKLASIDVTVTADGRLLGTPAYMSPEQARGKGAEIDHRSDIYALGVVLYEMLTGGPPFRGDIRMLVTQILFNNPTPPRRLNDRIPRDVETICMKCLAKRPADRYSSAQSVADDLRRVLAGRPIQARPIPGVVKFWRAIARHPALALLSATMVLIGVGAAAALGAAYFHVAASLAEANRNLYFHEIVAANGEWLENDRLGAAASLEACPREMRSFEWGYLKRLQATAEARLHNAGGALAYTPDGKTLVTGGGSISWLCLWDAATHEAKGHILGPTSEVTHLDCSPDGRTIATTCSGDPLVRLWDLDTRRYLRVAGRHIHEAADAQFSPDGSMVISHGIATSFVRVCETATGHERLAIDLHGGRICDLAVSPVDSLLAVCCRQGEEMIVEVWDYEADEKKYEETMPGAGSVVLAFSPDGEQLAMVHAGGMIRLWTLEPFECLAMLSMPVASRPVIAFDSLGSRLAYAGWDNTVHVCDVATGRELRVFRGHVGRLVEMEFSPCGQFLAASGEDDEVYTWDTSSDQGVMQVQATPSPTVDLAYSPTGDRIVSTHLDGTVAVWDAETGDRIALFSFSADGARQAAFSPDGERLLIATRTQGVRIYDIHGGELLTEFQEHTRPLKTVAWSPDRRVVASAGRDRRIRIWRPEDGRVLHAIPRDVMEIRDLAFSPDGRLLAVGDLDGRLTVHDVRSGRTLWDVLVDNPAPIWSIAWSPDGRWVAASHSDGRFLLHDAEDGRVCRRSAQSAQRQVTDIVFTSDGDRFITAVEGASVSIWETESARPVLGLRRDAAISGVLAFSPNGRELAVGGVDGIVTRFLADEWRSIQLDR